MRHTIHRNRRLRPVLLQDAVFLVLFLAVAFGGCSFAPDREITAGRYTAGEGEVRVEKELSTAGEILDSHAYAKVSLVYGDENGSLTELFLENEPTFSLQRSAAGAVMLRPHNATPNWLSPLAEDDGVTHVYVDANKVDEQQFDAIAECLRSNLSDIEEDCNQPEKQGGKKTERQSIKLASVRYYDARLHQQSYDWDKNRQVMVFIDRPGNVWLELDANLKGRTVTRMPSKSRIRIGVVLPDAKTILTSAPANLMNHPEMARADKLKKALEEHASDLPGLFAQCFDFAGQTIGDRFELQLAPSWEECLREGTGLAQ